MAITDIYYNSATVTPIVIQENTINLASKTVSAVIQTLDGLTSTAVLTARFTVTQIGIPSIFTWDPAGLALTRGIYRVQFAYLNASNEIDKTSDWVMLLVR